MHNVMRPERLHRVDLGARAHERAGTGSRPCTWLSGFALAELLTRRPSAIPFADRSAPSPRDITREERPTS
jgi:hypothetical protein